MQKTTISSINLYLPELSTRHQEEILQLLKITQRNYHSNYKHNQVVAKREPGFLGVVLFVVVSDDTSNWIKNHTPKDGQKNRFVPVAKCVKVNYIAKPTDKHSKLRE